LAHFPANSQSAPPASQRAILVTGASTGIGRKITERLAAHGYFVYAGARKDTDLVALNTISGVRAIRLDVTHTDEIDAAVKTIALDGRGLYGLVNNAGISSSGSLVEMPPEEFDLTMRVNVYGPYLVTRAVGPLVIASKGRIVNIGSIRGIVSDSDLGAYQMSKHAIESFTDVLAKELAPVGVNVSLIDPVPTIPILKEMRRCEEAGASRVHRVRCTRNPMMSLRRWNPRYSCRHPGVGTWWFPIRNRPRGRSTSCLTNSSS
jgi:NAD(P)-dependent dehydrogenase (short-subunit alcohol dehydrogenase family)